MTDQSITPLDQKTVEFHEDQLVAIRASDGGIYVPIKPICEALSVQWAAQSKRIRRDPVLSDVSASMSIMDMQSDPPQRRTMTCLPLDYLNGWLFGINSARIKDQVIRERVVEYQKECYQVLAEAFGTRAAHARETSPAIQALMQVREMGLAIAHLAEEQIEFEMRLTTTESKLDQAVIVVETLTERVDSLEKQVAPGTPVTQDQASQISQAVKTVAMKLSTASGTNQYGSVYGELYRKFGVTSYKQLPMEKFTKAMNWLNEWRESIEGDRPF